MEWSWLGWVVPLVVGAGLTFFFGWLDSTLRYRRQAADATAERNRQDAERRRIESRDHAQRALTLTSLVRDDIYAKRQETERTWSMSVEWDEDLVRELRDVGILIPDPAVRQAIADATNLVTASSVLAEAEGWLDPPPTIQYHAMVALRVILGAYLRQDEPDESAISRLREKAVALGAEWERTEKERRDYEAETSNRPSHP